MTGKSIDRLLTYGIPALVLAMVLFANGFRFPPRIVGCTFPVTCQGNLTQLYFALQTYANDSLYAMFPPLSPVPGVLLPSDASEWNARGAVEPAKLVCPKDLEKEWDIPSLSYLYLGYAVTNDDEAGAFSKVYRECVEKGISFDRNLTAPDGKGTLGGNIFVRLRARPDANAVRTATDAAIERSAHTIPILIEHLDNHYDDGVRYCNVAFLDGHFETIHLGEKWPVTERTMKALDSIEQIRAPEK
jgi:prepilin-type processing-associated H-X9-DG protein